MGQMLVLGKLHIAPAAKEKIYQFLERGQKIPFLWAGLVYYGMFLLNKVTGQLALPNLVKLPHFLIKSPHVFTQLASSVKSTRPSIK